MAFLRAKADFNKEAADVLFQQSLYAPSVHCAYYSCFQLLKYILKTKLNKPYAQQAAEISASTGGTHAYIKSQILREIASSDRQNYTDVNRKLGDLKLFRERADYDNVQIDIEFSEKSIRYATELRHYFMSNML